MVKYKIVIIPKSSEDAAQLDYSYIVPKNVKWYGHSGEQFGSF